MHVRVVAAAVRGRPTSHVRIVRLASGFCGKTHFVRHRTFSIYTFDHTNTIPAKDHFPPNAAKGVADATNFRKAVVGKSIHDIRSSYGALSPLLDQVTDGSAGILVDSCILVDALGILASAKQEAWVADLMRLIASDLEKYFKDDIEPRIHDSVIDGFLGRDDVGSAQQWLTDMHSRPGIPTPTQEQWSTLLAHCVAQHDASTARSIFQAMRDSGLAITAPVYQALFEDLRCDSDVPPSHIVVALLDEMKRDGIPYGSFLDEHLARAHVEAGLPDHASDVHSAFAPKKSSDGIHYTGRDLANVARVQGNRAALQLYKKLRFEGFTASLKTLKSILYDVSNPSAVKFWEDALQIKADAAAWALVIKNAIARGHLPVALASYQRALDSGIRPINAMIHPILRALCSSLLHPPTDATIDRAISLFQDFTRFHDEALENIAHSALDESAPDAATYNTLLRALASSKNARKYYPIAISLLEDMQKRNVTMDSMTTTSLVIIFMRLSASVPDAFKAYEVICRTSAQKWKLDAEGYVVVLNAFCQLSTKLTGYPTTRLYMEIVKDMRMAGYPITEKVYTVILQQLAGLGKRVTAAGNVDLRLARLVRRVHNFMTVDASLAPTVIVWNQLMDTYQRCGCFAEALLVWDNLYISRRHDNASVSIVLDTCAFADAYEVADRIYTKLKADGFPLNIRNWNNWLECLCRLGRIVEATRVLCVEMGRGGVVGPNTESARIVLKFAANVRMTAQVCSKIKDHQPELWDRLPPELRVGRT